MLTSSSHFAEIFGKQNSALLSLICRCHLLPCRIVNSLSGLLAVLAILLTPLLSWGQNPEKIKVNLDFIEGLALKTLEKPWSPVKDDSLLPDELKGLTYDQVRNIRFKPEMQIWKADRLPFRLALFHLGYLFRLPVEVNEFTATHSQKIRFARAFFDYTNSGVDAAALPSELGYAGFRVHHPLNLPDVFDELCVFQGASYYRMLGREQIYGSSARGLAIDTGLDKQEEFPFFTHFWVGKPDEKDTTLKIYALLNSPSVTGAYEFVISPGTDTAVDIRQTLFFRSDVAQIGIAPMTSMFWFGENTKKIFDDFRPEVHDCDGLSMKLDNGEFIWRPVENDPARKRIFSFIGNNIRGFGLLQRDRDFRNYQDLEALYHRRPGIWIEPVGDWGEGEVKLVELPTTNELNDNIVAFWQPKEKPQLKQPYRLAYRQLWTSEQNPGRAGGYVISTRSGLHDWAPGERFVMVDFVGETLNRLPPGSQPVAEASTLDPSVEALDAFVQKNPFENSWRVSFRLKVKEGVARPQNVETRCFIRHGEDVLTETWSCLMPL